MDNPKITENSQNQPERILIVQPRENKQSPQNGAEDPICRICFRGSSHESLISPCKCKGSLRCVHRSCLEHWLGSRNGANCEICQHEFATCRIPKKFWEWCRNPDSRRDRRNLIGDILCFILLTPLGMTSFWLCVQGAAHYYNSKTATWETAALLALASCLVIAYAVWMCLSIRYHYFIYSKWRDSHWHVRVLDTKPGSVLSSESSTHSHESEQSNAAGKPTAKTSTMSEPIDDNVNQSSAIPANDESRVIEENQTLKQVVTSL